MLGIEYTVDDVLEVLVPDRSSFETFAALFISERMRQRIDDVYAASKPAPILVISGND